MAVAITQTANPAGVTATSNVATYTSASIGTAAADRIVVVLVATELASSTPSACTIGGVAATAGTTGNFGAMYARAFYLAVPTGTTATIAVTYSATNPLSTSNHIAVYSVTGGTYSSAGGNGSTDMDVTAPLTTGAITIPADGGFIAVAGGATDTVAKAWANATADLDVDAGTFRFTTATRTTALTSTAVTCTGTTNGEDGALSYLIFASSGVSLPYTENFEGGSLPASFDSYSPSGGATAVIDGTSKITSTYSVKMAASAAGSSILVKDLLANYTELYIQFKIFIPTAFAYGSAVTIIPLQIQDSGSANVLVFKLEDYGTQQVILQGGTLGYTNTGQVIGKNAVKKVELYYKTDASTGAWKVWIDNDTEGSPTASGSSLNTGTAQMRIIQIGNAYSAAAFTDNYYVDEVVVSNAFIGAAAPSTPTNLFFSMFN